MNRHFKVRRAALVAGMLAASAWPLVTRAHGDAGHGQAAAAVKKEQTAWGIAGDKRQVSRTVQVGMGDDMRFTPASLSVKQGDTLRFVIHNRGRLMHEFVLGHKPALDEHAALMLKFPDMEHDAPYTAHVAPGKTGDIIWTFNRAGDVDFACLIAGHYQAGMVGRITVQATTPRRSP